MVDKMIFLNLIEIRICKTTVMNGVMDEITQEVAEDDSDYVTWFVTFWRDHKIDYWNVKTL